MQSSKRQVRKKIEQAAKVLTEEQKDEVVKLVLNKMVDALRSQLDDLQKVLEISINFQLPIALSDGRTMLIELKKEQTILK